MFPIDSINGRHDEWQTDEVDTGLWLSVTRRLRLSNNKSGQSHEWQQIGRRRKLKLIDHLHNVCLGEWVIALAARVRL